MLSRILISVLFICSGEVGGGQQPTSPLPPEWHGTWTGTMVNTTVADKRSEVPLTLKIEPIKDTREVTWVITFGKGGKGQVRDYKLVPAGDKPGRFRIDERNGTALDARLVNGVIYSHFKVGDSALTARYELRGDTLRYEVTSAKPVPEKSGKGNIQGYTVEVVQTAELKKG
jgi:hypothetical protein